MSQTVFVEYKGNGFWAYHVALGVLLKHLIDAASVEAVQSGSAWLQSCTEKWRVNAVVPDFSLVLDKRWSDAERATLVRLLDEVVDKLTTRATISSQEMETWEILDGKGVPVPAEEQLSTRPVAELGRTIQQLLQEQLPSAPEGHWWFYGTEDGRDTHGRELWITEPVGFVDAEGATLKKFSGGQYAVARIRGRAHLDEGWKLLAEWVNMSAPFQAGSHQRLEGYVDPGQTDGSAMLLELHFPVMPNMFDDTIYFTSVNTNTPRK